MHHAPCIWLLGRASHLEELAEALHRLAQVARLHVKVEDRVLGVGLAVVRAAARREVGAPAILVGKLLGTHEEHVLSKVREPAQVGRIAQVAHADGHSAGRLLARVARARLLLVVLLLTLALVLILLSLLSLLSLLAILALLLICFHGRRSWLVCHLRVADKQDA